MGDKAAAQPMQTGQTQSGYSTIHTDHLNTQQ